MNVKFFCFQLTLHFALERLVQKHQLMPVRRESMLRWTSSLLLILPQSVMIKNNYWNGVLFKLFVIVVGEENKSLCKCSSSCCSLQMQRHFMHVFRHVCANRTEIKKSNIYDYIETVQK